MELLLRIYGRCFLAVGDILWAYFNSIFYVLVLPYIYIYIIIYTYRLYISIEMGGGDIPIVLPLG